MSNGAPPQKPFDKLLFWLDPDRDKAAQKYERIRLRLIKILAAKGRFDAEDLADATVNVVESKIDWLLENYEGDPALYFYGVAKNVYRDILKEDEKKRRRPPPPPPDKTEIERHCIFLEECLRELPEKERSGARRYHEGDKQDRIKNRRLLAEEWGITLNALRIKMWHIHVRLRKCMHRLLQESRED